MAILDILSKIFAYYELADAVAIVEAIKEGLAKMFGAKDAE